VRKVRAIIKQDMMRIKKEYSDARRTQILIKKRRTSRSKILIAEEDVIVTGDARRLHQEAAD
jgi:DNA gyrase/topoisomerase IV subunit A